MEGKYITTANKQVNSNRKNTEQLRQMLQSITEVTKKQSKTNTRTMNENEEKPKKRIEPVK